MVNLGIDKMDSLKKKGALTLLLLFALQANAQNDFCSAKNTSFKDGEKLIFSVYYSAGFVRINAGNASFTTSLEDMNGRKVYHIIGDGKTAKSYEWFYK